MDEGIPKNDGPARFPLGRVVGTPGALAALETAGVDAWALLGRHASGDWGELSDADRQENEDGLSRRRRLFSSYPLGGDVTVWVITEADRSATTLLLPGEY